MEKRAESLRKDWQLHGAWYAVDVTWNDPSVANGGSAAVSSYESENYLLVGADTIISGRTFLASHPVNNQASSAGVHFTNGPQLNSTAYDFKTASSPTPVEEPETSQEQGLPFADVSTSDWFYTSIVWAYDEGLMTGERHNFCAEYDDHPRHDCCHSPPSGRKFDCERRELHGCHRWRLVR